MFKFLLLVCAIAVPCAYATLRETAHLYNGENAQIGEFPYMAYIIGRKFGVDQIVCGASIIGERLILTAAHCVYDLTTRTARVGLGTLRPYEDEGVVHEIEKIVVHGDYLSSGKLDSDIAVILLRDDIIFNDAVQPIRLAPRNYKISNGKDAVIAGWGYTNYPFTLPDNLQKLMVKIVTARKCQNLWIDSSENAIDNGMICAEPSNSYSYEGLCYGDSGSPLVTSDGFQVGIANMILYCGMSNRVPDVYTNVIYYADWINQTIERLIGNYDFYK